MILAFLIWSSHAKSVCTVGRALAFKVKPNPICEVVSRADGKTKSIYTLQCGEEIFRFRPGQATAERLDPLSLSVLGSCSTKVKELQDMVSDFEVAKSQIEKPACALERKQSQMTYHTPLLEGRCSFRMNQNEYQSFLKATGLQPSYQCENHVFLVGSEIYSEASGHWTHVCAARLQVQPDAAPANIDWSHPPDFYEPPEPLITP